VNRASSIFGGLIVIAIAVVFIVNFQPGGGQNQLQQGPDCAAEIHGKCIRSGHFWAAVRLLAPRGAESEQLRRLRVRNMALDGLVERELLVADAKRLGVSVGEDDLTRELRAGRIRVSLPSSTPPSLPMYLGMQEAGIRQMRFLDRKTNKFSPEVYKRDVTDISRLSETDFREFQREELIAARMRDIIRSRVRISEQEAKQQFEREKTTRVVKYLKIERPYLAMHVVDPTPDAVKTWAAANQAEIDSVFESRKDRFAEGCRETRHILRRVDPGAPTAEADKKAALEKIADAKKRIEGGESFADVARALSEDGSASRGGKLGCVVKGQMVKPFEDALFALGKDGALSDAVESQFGIHLIVLDKAHTGPAAIEAGKAQAAEELYVAHESERLAAEGAKEILAAVRGGKPLDEARLTWLARVRPPKAAPKKKKAEGDDKSEPAPTVDESHELEPTIETSLPFNVMGSPFDGVAPGYDAATSSFAIAKVGDVATDVLPLVGGGYAVIQLDKLSPATDEAWSRDRDYYVSAIRSQKQQEALASYVAKLRKAATSDIKVSNELVADPSEAASASSADGPAPPAPIPMPE
jgi:peptidyl-prolyl cis-trans isomerase D